MPLTRAPLFSWEMRRKASASPLIAPGAGRANRSVVLSAPGAFGGLGGELPLDSASDRALLPMSEVPDTVPA